jgi:DNA primase
MSFSKNALLEEAKQMDMVDYLSKLGYEPTKVRSQDYWYLSPLREEKTASFKINRKMNRWYDHGLGKGGNLIDFAILYHHSTVAEFLKNLCKDFSFHQPLEIRQDVRHEKRESRITILKERAISSLSLQRYLYQRRIPLEVAESYCKEVTYELDGKEYYGIGFKNDSGGYEIRNPYFKTSSAPKDIKTIINGAKEAVLFEGFFDFLSFIAIHKNQPQTAVDYVVLNSIVFFEKARTFMERHESIKLFLDRDSTGQKVTQYALSLGKQYRDESHLYKNYKDLNDWMVNFGKVQKKNLKL